MVANRIVFSLIALLLLAGAIARGQGEDMIGLPTIYVTRDSDTLLDIAHGYDLGGTDAPEVPQPPPAPAVAVPAPSNPVNDRLRALPPKRQTAELARQVKG